MNLENKQFSVSRMHSHFVPVSTLVYVEVFETIDETARKLFATFELQLDGAFNDPHDAGLLTAIASKLETL